MVFGAATLATTALSIARGSHHATGRAAVDGVLMPDPTHYREIATQLLTRKHPERLRGLTITGDAGRVRVLRYRPGSPSFLSSYLNPKIIEVLARSAGATTNAPLAITQLRLEVLSRTGRQRWRLSGMQLGRQWRATVNPNGTDLRLIHTGPGTPS